MEIITLNHVDLDNVPPPLSTTRFASIVAQSNTYVVGDLHGNFIRLLVTLLHFDFIRMKDFTTPINVPFAQLSEMYQTDRFSYDAFILLLNKFFAPTAQPGKKLIFIGDTICDRGVSDFMTLSVFQWMRSANIQFQSLLGNHELTILFGKAFTSNPRQEYFIDFVGKTPVSKFFRSFDYFRLPDSTRDRIPLKRLFKSLCMQSLTSDRFLFIAFPSTRDNPPILLTHAPVTHTLFDQVIQLYESDPHTPRELNFIWEEVFHEPVKSTHIQAHFNRWLMRKLAIALEAEDIPAEDEALWDVLGNFCGSRAEDQPFFSEQNPSRSPKTVPMGPPVFDFTQGVHPRQRVGMHIFGHMAGIYGDRRPDALHYTQACIDTTTGMPKKNIGPIVYACI